MAQSLAEVLVHIVFSTKHRRPWLRDEVVRQELHAYMAGVLGNIDSPALAIDGVEDHVHMLVRLSRTTSLSDLVQAVKVEPSKWIKQRGPDFRSFAGQAGYGAFSVSASKRDQVKTYIQQQAKHHVRLSFQDEFRALCERHGVSPDERFAWD